MAGRQRNFSFKDEAGLVVQEILRDYQGGRAIDRVFATTIRAAEAHERQIKTSQLNDFLTNLRETGHTVSSGKRRLRLQYATQTGTRPPVFTFWCNAPDLVDDNYERYLENRLREAFDLEGTPIRLKFRRKDEKS